MFGILNYNDDDDDDEQTLFVNMFNAGFLLLKDYFIISNVSFTRFKHLK